MKKLLIPLLILLLAPVAHAQTATDNCNTGDPQYACTSDQVCKGSPVPTCQANTVQQSAGTCTVDAGCVNYGAGWTCSKDGTCVAPSSNGGSDTSFTALAPIPGLTDSSQNVTSGNFATFFNNLYKYLVGLAATLAVIMIIWGGLEIATQDSIASHGAGRHRIQQALYGLALVLSPVLVFSIINPSILSLSIGIGPLQTQWGAWKPAGSSDSAQTQTNGNVTTTGSKLYSCDSSGCGNAQNSCISGAPGGYTAQDPVVCVKSDQSIDPNGRTDSSWNGLSSYSCVSGETLAVNCSYSMTYTGH